MIGLICFFSTMAITAVPFSKINSSGIGLVFCLLVSAFVGLKVHFHIDLKGEGPLKEFVTVDWSALKDKDEQIICAIAILLICLAAWFLYSQLSK